MSKAVSISETLILAIVTWVAGVVAWLIRGEVKWQRSQDRIDKIEQSLEALAKQSEAHGARLASVETDGRQVGARLDRIERKIDTLNSYLLGKFAGAEDCS